MQNSFEMRLEKFRRSIDRLGIQAHANFIAYLLILLYFFVSVASTTHEEILKEAPKSIPLLSIQVPFLWFAVIGPWVILLVHLNQLLQYYYLSKNTFVLKKIISSLLQPAASDEVSSTSYFLVTNLILTDSNFLRVTIKFFLWVFLVVGPIVICVLFLGFFLPYHSLWITWNHRVVVILDAVAIFCFWPKILFGEAVGSDGVFSKFLFKNIRKIFLDCGPVTISLMFAALVFCGVLCLPGEFLDIFPAEIQSNKVLPSDSDFAATDALAYDLGVIVSKNMEGATYFPSVFSRLKGVIGSVYGYAQQIFPRNLELANKLLIKAEPSYALLSQYSRSSSSYYPAMVGLVKEQGLGLDLRRRDLRYANFSGSYMPSCVLTNANLDHSNFSFGHLENATFGDLNSKNEMIVRSSRGDEMRNAAYNKKMHEILYAGDDSLCKRIIDVQGNGDVFPWEWSGTKKDYTSISYANFWAANLSGASFVNVKSSFSNFSSAMLEGCCFRDTSFFCVNLFQASIKKSVFLYFDLVFSNVADAFFYQTHFFHCRVIGTSVAVSRFDSVLMVWVDFDSSVLMSSFFSNTMLVSTMMQRTAFVDNVISETFFKNSSAKNCILQKFDVEGSQKSEDKFYHSISSESDTYGQMVVNAFVRYYKKCIKDKPCRIEKNHSVVIDEIDVSAEKYLEHVSRSMDEFVSSLGGDLKKQYLLGPGPVEDFHKHAAIFFVFDERYSKVLKDEFDKYQPVPMY